MNVNPNIVKAGAIIKHFEGFYENAYPDTGNVWTVGLGSTYNFDKGRKVMKGDKTDYPTALRYLEIETRQKVIELNRYIKQPLNPDQSAALLSYTYNRGIGNLLKTKIDDYINVDPFDPKILTEIKGTGLWDRLGHKLWGLGRRRRAEAHLYATGELKFEWPRWG